MREKKKRIAHSAVEARGEGPGGGEAVSGQGHGFHPRASVDVAGRPDLDVARAEGVIADGGEQVL